MTDNLPSKLPKTDRYRDAEKVRVLLNSYKLDVEKMVDRVFYYELKFWALNSQNKQIDLSEAFQRKNDVARQLRHATAMELYKKLLTTNVKFFHITDPKDLSAFLYDLGSNFYCIEKLMDVGQKQEFVLKKDGLSEQSLGYLRPYQEVTAKLMAVQEIDFNLDQMSVVLQDEGRACSFVQFLDILTSQKLIFDGKHYVFDNKMYLKDSKISLGRDEPRVLKEGLQKNVRLVGETTSDAIPIVQIDVKKSPFFPEMPLDEFSCLFLAIRSPRQLTPQLIENLRKQTQNLSVVTTHLSPNITINIAGITSLPSTRVPFELEGKQIYVADYIQQKYNLRLREPLWPCAIQNKRVKLELQQPPEESAGEGGSETTFAGLQSTHFRKQKSAIRELYYPLELLRILPGQRVNDAKQKQGDGLKSKMIKCCQERPAQLREGIERQRRAADIDNLNPYFGSFGLSVLREPLETEASVLFPPAIDYRAGNSEQSDRVEPNDEGRYTDGWSWKLAYRRFIEPVELRSNDWIAVTVQACVSQQEKRQFLEAFIRAAKNRGVSLQFPIDLTFDSSDNFERLRDMFLSFVKHRYRFALFITRNEAEQIHHAWKLLEQQTGIITQHVLAKTLHRANGRGGGSNMIFDNLLMKFNLKLGGVNQGIATGQAFMRLNKITHDIVSEEWLGGGRMFIGLEISGAGAQTLFERQAGVRVSEPNVIGMAYTVGQNVVRMQGPYWMQPPRVTTIVNGLKQRVKQALSHFAKHCNGAYPGHLVVYRSGVSEGEYSKVANEERREFTDAFVEILAESPSSRFRTPSLTIVVCQRRSNYRITPSGSQRLDPRSKQNVHPGTVVDGEALNPKLTEFLLVGHVAIQGTANPLRCSVVYDDIPDRVPIHVLENVTYLLCFAHGIVNSPVSVPAPLYAANELAKRGRNNYRTKMSVGGEDDLPGPSQRSSVAGDETQDQAYYITVSDQLAPKIDTKFWA